MMCTVANQYVQECDTYHIVHPMVQCNHVTCLKRMHEQHIAMKDTLWTIYFGTLPKF